MTIFAFLGIETTGLSPDDDHILEIAWLLTDSKLETLTPLRSHISEHSKGEWQDIWYQLQSNEPVRHMHQESGLLNAIRSHKAWPLSTSALQFRDDIENVRRELGDYDGTEHSVHLAGLSISLDRDFLKKDPTWALFFDNDVLGVSLHQRLLDLSSLKMFLTARGVPWDRAMNSRPHRAASDVLETLAQARSFWELLTPLTEEEN